MMLPLACSDCAENCVHLQLANKGSARKIERFVKVIMGKDHDKVMYLPPVIAPMMNWLSGKELRIEDAGGCFWPMLLTTVNGGLAFTNGWVPFYRHHNLEECSFVVFEYKVGTDSLFVHVFSKDGSETLQKNCENSANGMICQSSETVFLEDALEGFPSKFQINLARLMHSLVSLKKVRMIQKALMLASNFDFVIDSAEEGVDFDLKSLNEFIDAYVGSPNRDEAMDACGKRKGVDCIKWRIPKKKRTPVMYIKPNSAQRNREPVAVAPRSESPKCVELPIPIPPVPCTRFEDSVKVIYLRDPKERVWPFINLSKQSVKVLADKWEKFCVENSITEIDECRFEAEKGAYDFGVYRVSVVGRPFN